VIVYCYDYQSDLSPRAAWRLEGSASLALTTASLARPTGAFGLPLEGEPDSRTRIGSIAGGDTPTCRPDEFFSAVAQRVADEWQICVVTNEKRIIMGILGRRALRPCFPFPAEEAMSAGPSTLRPSARLDAVALRTLAQRVMLAEEFPEERCAWARRLVIAARQQVLVALSLGPCAFLLHRQLGSGHGLKTRGWDRPAALDREAIRPGGQTLLGTLEGGELSTQIVGQTLIQLLLV
jgi:hypothetical protein